jgi:hypothetical protein
MFLIPNFDFSQIFGPHMSVGSGQTGYSLALRGDVKYTPGDKKT